MRTLWLHLETTGLNTEYTNVLGLSYWPEVRAGEGCSQGPRHLSVQPLLHEEDLAWGHHSLDSVVNHFNRGLTPDSPERLAVCSVKDKALFAYERSALTYLLDPPARRDPLNWLLDKTRLSPRTVLAALAEDLLTISSDGQHQRWTLASYNGSFCLGVFVAWIKRVLGEESQAYLNAFNRFYTLDTLSLVRWAQYQGRLESHGATLKAVASALGVKYTLNPEALSLSELLAARDVAGTLLSGNNNEHYQKPRIPRSEIPSKDLA